MTSPGHPTRVVRVALARYTVRGLVLTFGSLGVALGSAWCGAYADDHRASWGEGTKLADAVAIPLFCIFTVVAIGGCVALVTAVRLALFLHHRPLRAARCVVGSQVDGAEWRQPRVEVEGASDFLVLSGVPWFWRPFRGADALFAGDDRRGVVVTDDARGISFAARNPISGMAARSRGLV